MTACTQQRTSSCHGPIHPGPSRAWNTALCLIPPPSLWPTFQRLRHTLDPVNAKWPPHINLLYPFTAADADLAQTAQLIQSAVAPLFLGSSDRIHIQLRTRANPFIRGKSAKVSAEPLDPAPLIQLHDALHAAFPHFTRTTRYGPYAPHLNVALAPWNPGQPKQTQGYLDEVTAAVKSLLESDHSSCLVEWEAFGVYVLVREDETPFAFATYVPFTATGDWQDPYGLVGSTWNADMYAPDFSRMHRDSIGLGMPEDADRNAMDVDALPPTVPRLDSVPVWQCGQYPFVASPGQLVTDPACDEAWVRLPAYQFDSIAGNWVPIPTSQLDADSTQAHIPASLSILTYNIFNDRHNPNTPHRLPLVVAELERQHQAGVSIINLQECTPEFLIHLLAAPWVRAHYSITHTLDWATVTFPRVGSPVTLVRGPTPFAHMHVRYSGAKSSLCVQIPLWRAMVANVHLTSSHSSNGADSESRRSAQMEPIGRLLKRHTPSDWLAVVAGDFNTPSTKEEDEGLLWRHGLVDSVQLLGGKCLLTFNPRQNPLAGYSPSMPVAIDRVVVRSCTDAQGFRWAPVNQGLVGTEHPASDHYGLLVTFMANSQAISARQPTPPIISDESLLQSLCNSNPNEFDCPDQLRCRAAVLDSVSAFCIRSLSHLPYARHIPALIPIDLVRYGLARPGDAAQAAWFVDMEPKAVLGHLTHLDTTLASQTSSTSDTMHVDRSVIILGHSPCPWSPSSAITIHFQASASQLISVHVMDPGVQIHTHARDLLLNPDSRSHHWPVSNLKRSVTSAIHPVRDANDVLARINAYPSFRIAFRVLRQWAERSGVLASCPLSPHMTPSALLVLLMRTALVMSPDACAAALVCAFFKDYSTFPFASLAIALDRYPTTRASSSSVAVYIESVARPGVNLAANVSASSRDAFVDVVRQECQRHHVLGLLEDASRGWNEFVRGFPEFVVVTVGWSLEPPSVTQTMVKQIGIPWAKVMSAAEKVAERDGLGGQMRLWSAPCCSVGEEEEPGEVHHVIGIRCPEEGTASAITSKVASLVQSLVGANMGVSATWWNHVRRVSRQLLKDQVTVICM